MTKEETIKSFIKVGAVKAIDLWPKDCVLWGLGIVVTTKVAKIVDTPKLLMYISFMDGCTERAETYHPDHLFTKIVFDREGYQNREEV